MTAVVHPPVADPEWIGERALSKLRWRCRRGLLENDLFVERFFQRHAHSLNAFQARGLTLLMDLSDNDLLDLWLGRTPAPSDVSAEFTAVLQLLRATAIPATSVPTPA
jgi:antitoxin CptB